MRYELEELRNWIAATKGNDPLPSYDPRYIDLENFEYQNQRVQVRTGSWSTPLIRGILANPVPTCQVFSGFAGTGKSTELLKLKTQLERQDFTVLLIDLAEWHDLQHPLSIEDMLVILAMAIEEQAYGQDPKTSSFFNRFVSTFKTQLEVPEVKVGLKLIDLKVLLKSPNEIWQKIRNRLSLSVGRLRELAHKDIADSIDHIQAKDGRPVVVIFDSLEKLSGNEFTWKETMLSVENVFSNASVLRLPKCHVIYTLPPYTALINHSISDLYDGGVFLPLPAIKIRDRHDQVYEPGLAALKALIAKRIPVEKVFGTEPEPLRRLLLMSGGHVRTVLKMVHDILVHNLLDEFPVSAALVDGIIGRYAERARNAIRPEGIPLLQSIRTLRNIDHIKDDELPLLARYMDNHLVLSYQNGEGWFQVHELIRDSVASRAAELRSSEGG